MDGVLVDVQSSYRRAIQETVGFFTGRQASLEEIQMFKEKGGYNNDWDLTEAILLSRSRKVPRADVISTFQRYYFGSSGQGFIRDEKWLLSREILKRLNKRFVTGIVTGRPRREASFVLERFEMKDLFKVIVVLEDYPEERSKPDPYPLCLALRAAGTELGFYVGDSVDDIISAKRAGIEAVGCVPPGISDKDRLKERFLSAGAKRVLDSIDEVDVIC
jgi:HAD superfamily hydrolase (TIGR01548 family)